jgi:hypothetical protein
MNPNTIREMEPHIRQKYFFASSSFARIFGVPKVTKEMYEFCIEWAYWEEHAPLDCLNHVDRYFRQLWEDRWKNT